MKKILKVVLIILCIGFISAFVRGYRYNFSKDETKENIVKTEDKINSEKSIIDEEIITDLLDKETKENDPVITNTSKTEDKKETNIKNVPEQKPTTNSSNIETKNNSSSQNQNKIKEEVKETKEVKQENISTSNNTSNTTTSNTQKNSYIGVPNPNDFYYSFHHGNIDKQYSDLNSCYADSARVGLKDTVDILNITCFEVLDSQGTVLGIYMYVNCQSGNCERYK